MSTIKWDIKHINWWWILRWSKVIHFYICNKENIKEHKIFPLSAILRVFPFHVVFCVMLTLIMNREFKQRLSTIPQISTTRIASSPQTTALKTDPHMELEIHVLTWYKHKNMTGLYRLLGSKPSHSCNWISNDNADKNKQLNTQKDHTFKTWLSQLYGPIWIKQIIGISSRSWRFRITMNFQ